ncbi:hypothetical protein J4771_02910 [Candidatus Kaistella beijingensis]|uniref:hypothetical protein n=1 Tax=Candidatus Kaistella beijingensis TaxID=2820270 RepID=UPI001CC46D94|nr:hypothetical protein [Candidatus Kaistella beijingensis]UBB90324.1 hypothetical protein J4771_02910 [Candidatus Kaistella beijingensis]
MNLENLVKDLRNKLITLDCNVLLLLIIGSVDKKHISNFKRTSMFTEEHYDILIKLISNSQILLTPNVITEASNLLESYSYDKQKVGLKFLKNICANIPESYEKSVKLVELEIFNNYGLSDSSVFNLCKVGAIAITIDFNLYISLLSNNLGVINFNHLIFGQN